METLYSLVSIVYEDLTQFAFRIFSILFCDITPGRNSIIVQNKVVDTKYLLTLEFGIDSVE